MYAHAEASLRTAPHDPEAAERPLLDVASAVGGEPVGGGTGAGGEAVSIGSECNPGQDPPQTRPTTSGFHGCETGGPAARLLHAHLAEDGTAQHMCRSQAESSAVRGIRRRRPVRGYCLVVDRVQVPR